MASNHQESEENQSLNLDFDALDHLGMEMNVNGITFDLSDIQPGNPQNNHFMSENSGPEGNKNQAQIQIQHQDFTTNEGLEDEILDSFSSSEGEETSEIPSATLSNEVSSASMVSSDQATQHQKNAEESSSAIQGWIVKLFPLSPAAYSRLSLLYTPFSDFPIYDVSDPGA